MGCFWHGCPVCYPDDRTMTKNPVSGQSMPELHFLTEKKMSYLRACGLKVTVMWEHEFLDQWKKDPNLRDFAIALDLTDRLNPRDAFYRRTDQRPKTVRESRSASTDPLLRRHLPLPLRSEDPGLSRRSPQDCDEGFRAFGQVLRRGQGQGLAAAGTVLASATIQS